MPRYNKNGIRILDDPKQDNKISNRHCMPGEHKWYKVSEKGDCEVIHISYECRNCNEKMHETKGNPDYYNDW